MDYLYQLINLVKHWFSYFGLASRQNFEDQFYQLLHDRNYDEALKLAHQHSYLDIDLVYKCKWRGSGITVTSIESILGRIQDKLWAINECVQTVPMSHEACRRLIEFGLSEANLKLLCRLGNETPTRKRSRDRLAYCISRHDSKREALLQSQQALLEEISDSEIEGLIDFDHLNEQQKELCRCRQDLLRYEHALFAYENVLGDYRTIQQHFDHVFYDEFRRKCPLNACIDYAHDGQARAVEVMLNFYTDELTPHVLTIASNLPETLSPYQYRNLLPCLRKDDVFYEWRAVMGSQIKRPEPEDWSCRGIANSAFRISVDDISESYEKEFYDSNQHLKKYLKPLTSEVLTEWFIERALEMESRTLLLKNALQLLSLGTELNIKNLTQLHEELTHFGRVVTECCSEGNIYLSFSEFRQMSDLEKLKLRKQKQFNSPGAKYKVLAFALAECDENSDPDGRKSAKILNHTIELRKRDESIQLAYLRQNM